MRKSREEEDTGDLLPSSYLFSFQSLVNTGFQGVFLRRGEEREERGRDHQKASYRQQLSFSSFLFRNPSFSSGSAGNRGCGVVQYVTFLSGLGVGSGEEEMAAGRIFFFRRVWRGLERGRRIS